MRNIIAMSNLAADKVILRNSRQTAVGLIIGGSLFGFIAILLFSQGETTAGLVACLGMPILLLVGIGNFIDRKSQIIIDDQGLTIKDGERINWSDIESAQLEWWWIRGATIIRIKYRNTVKKPSSIIVNGLELPPKQIYRLIATHIDTAKIST